MFKKMFFIVVLAALVLASLPGAASASPAADPGKFKQLAEVTKFAVLSTQPLTLQFKGYIACDKALVASSVSGKDIFITVSDIKLVGGGKPCSDSQNKGYTKQISLGTLVPGSYTVYVNSANGKAQKKFRVIAPMLPTPTAAPAQ